MKLLSKLIQKDSFVGISLNETTARVVEINSKGEVLQKAQMVMPMKSLSALTINTESLTEVLGQLCRQVNLPHKYVAISLPEYFSFSRIFSIPKLPLNQVTEALYWQIEKIFPLPKNDIYFDWKLINESDNNLNLLIVAMPKKSLDDLIQAFAAVNLRPIQFEPSASGVVRLLNLKPQDPTVLIEISPSGSSATLIENGVSSLTVTNQFEIQQDTRIALEQTSQSIQSLVNFHKNKYPENQTPIIFFLTGESASTELAVWLQSVSEYVVKLVEIPQIDPLYHQAYAAAASAGVTREQGVSLNLLPTSLRKYYDAVRNRETQGYKLTATLALGCLSLIVTLFASGASLIRGRQLQQQLKALEAANSQYTYNANIVSILNKNSQLIVSLFPKKTTPVEFFRELDNQVPDGVVITSYDYEAGKQQLSIIGTAEKREELVAFKDNLSKSSLFKNIQLPLEALEKPTEISFKLSLVLKPTNTK